MKKQTLVEKFAKVKKKLAKAKRQSRDDMQRIKYLELSFLRYANHDDSCERSLREGGGNCTCGMDDVSISESTVIAACADAANATAPQT